MTFEYQREIPSPKGIRAEIPMDPGLIEIKKRRDEELRQSFTGQSDKFVVIIGPCSAHDPDAVFDYVDRLAAVQETVAEKLILVPRIYTNKPRTTGRGYKGMLHQPDPNAKSNMVEGIRAIRRLHLNAMKKSELSAADEMLYPGNFPYLEDILSYVAIGARSTENQQHRLTASGFDVPAGFKNPMAGDLHTMLNSVSAGQSGHVFLYNNWQVETRGNPLSHAILRGAYNMYGAHVPNYHYEHLVQLSELYAKRDLKNPAVIIDANHSNSGKNHREQPRIAMEILHNRKCCPEVRRLVKGLMIESFIVEGSQGKDEDIYGKSITDPCLGWEESYSLLLDIAEQV